MLIGACAALLAWLMSWPAAAAELTEEQAAWAAKYADLAPPAEAPADPAARPAGHSLGSVARSAARGIDQTLSQLDTVLLPPAGLSPADPVDALASCEDLYAELNRLIPSSYSYRPKFHDSQFNALVGALGTVWWPAWLLWIVPEYVHWRERRQIDTVKARIRELRALSAEKQCWVY